MTVQEIYNKYSFGSYGNYHLLWGPTHIVWEDGNMSNSSLKSSWEFCMKAEIKDGVSLDDVQLCKSSLFMLALIPEEERYEQFKNLET